MFFSKKNVTCKATEGLENCADVDHKTYMIIVSQQSDSNLVFLHSPPCEFTYIVPLYKIDITEENNK